MSSPSAPGAASSDTRNGQDYLTRRPSHWDALRGLLPLVWPADRRDLRVRVVVAFGVLLLAKIVTVSVPVFYKDATDRLAEAAGTGSSGMYSVAVGIAMLILAYGTGRVLMMALNQVRDLIFTEVGQNAVRALNNRTFAHLHRLSLRFHLERRTGGLSRVIERATRGVELIIRMGILNVVPTVVELLLVSGMLLYYFDWRYVAIMYVTVGAYMWFTFAASERRIAVRREMNDSDTEANTKAVDSLLNFETVKHFGNEELEARRFDDSMARYERAAIKTFRWLAILNTGQTLIFTLGMTACMLMAGRGVVMGTHTIGEFVMINAMLIQLYMPLNFLGMVYREIKQGLVDLEQMFSLLGEAPEIEDRPGAKPLVVSRGEIRFNHVDFFYDAGKRQVLHDITFTVPAGKMVAIVGPSGAGKSTLARLMFRFYDVTSGAITIDGQNIRDVTQKSLRAAIGVVPQDSVLFNDTIFYNIKYGRPDAPDEEIYRAAQLAQIDSFIRSLPEGYETKVGERGLKLSGGEKQRVAIARTILKGPPILILDEATSALDSHTERDIQAALDEVSRERTSLVIAHRLSTIINADRILVMEKGRVMEQGTHTELISSGGLYAELWAHQREAEKAREELAHALEDAERAGALTSEDIRLMKR
ncbi:ABCB family ABC transporter ATP-binding protein/permease [Hyphomicrobium sulfonivorans]|uniref:ABCB family ABC transporter ATP-binding protein/permease n=1 Tax=Hyphomicrobium sulfonivorans TaxID=121290 RepID=UPI00156DE443|nr:ABC transporter ATP-binding protein/permease [Hyphomicrobium sulfonivorans]MBI1650364.1 ABC transporter ATP-binding protein/permease [Hyphomicrobium sulfonivorans]NSL72272.1 metal ABC transporter permease [Hyphomicrobium sulfonivorans]